MAPPLMLASLRLKSTLVSVGELWKFSMPPPFQPAWFSSKSTLVGVVIVGVAFSDGEAIQDGGGGQAAADHHDVGVVKAARAMRVRLTDIAAERGGIVEPVPLPQVRLGTRKAAVDLHPVLQHERDGPVGAAGRLVRPPRHPDLVARIQLARGQRRLQVGVSVGPALPVVAARGQTVDVPGTEQSAVFEELQRRPLHWLPPAGNPPLGRLEGAEKPVPVPGTEVGHDETPDCWY